jgi:predicted small secreted protein
MLFQDTLRGLRRNVTLAIILAMLGVSAQTACNTLEGAGDDLENVGDKVEDAVD